MYKHLQLTTLIMLIVLMLTPMSVLVAQVSSPFRCSECGGEPHIDPTACIKYAHASDCPCADCVAKRESAEDDNDTSLMDVLTEMSNLMPGTSQARKVWNYLWDRWEDLVDIQTVPYIEDPEHIPFN